MEAEFGVTLAELYEWNPNNTFYLFPYFLLNNKN